MDIWYIQLFLKRQWVSELQKRPFDINLFQVLPCPPTCTIYHSTLQESERLRFVNLPSAF